ncbi:MAG: MarR family transcriptional regulator [bacterium]
MGVHDQIDQQPALGGLEDSLGFLLRICQLRVYEAFYERFGEDELRPGEFSVMWVIHLNPGIRQGVLAATLRIKAAQMTKMVRRLEEQDKISREIPDDDRRSVRLTLTAMGESFIADQQAAFFGNESYHNHPLPPAEAAELARLLRKYAGFAEAGA